MNYMLLIYGDPAIWENMAEPERDQVLRVHADLVDELRRSGELVAGAGLAEPEVTVTVRSASASATSGPFAEDGPQMSAVYLVDCATPARARALAARIVDPHVPAVEVRPVHSLEPGG